MSNEVLILKVMCFIDLLGIGLTVPLVTNRVRQLDGSHIAVGALGSLYAGFQLGSGPLIGSWSDLKGRKNVLIFTLLMCSVTYVVMGTTSSVAIILITRAVLGLFKQTQMLTRAMVPDYEKSVDKQAAIYGKMTAISGIGITFGPVIGGHIAEDFHEYNLCIVSILTGICFLSNSGIAYYFLPDVKTRHPKRHTRHTDTSDSIIHTIYHNFKQSVVQLGTVKWGDYWDILLNKALTGFAMAVYFSNYSVYLRSIYGLTPKYIGYILSFQSTITSTCSYFMWYIRSFYSKDKEHCLQNFHIFILLFVSLLGLVLSFNIYMYILWVIPLAIGNAMARLIALDMLLQRSHGEHRGKLMGVSHSVTSLAGVVAPMVSGFVAHHYGVSYVLYPAISSTFLGLLMCYNCFRLTKLKRH